MFSKDNIKKVACVGSGTIGSSWATCFAMNGYETSIYDINDEQLEMAKKKVESNLDFLCAHAVFDADEAEKIKKRISFSTDLGMALDGALFIQESAPENVEIKASVLEEVDRYASEEAVIASSTSGLLISDIAKKSKMRHRCVGAHPFNPPHLIPLVELVKADFTDDGALQCALEFYKAVGKEPIVLQRECAGFVANRLQLALFREAADLVNRGVCTVEDMDKALTFGPGLRWGIMGAYLVYHLATPRGISASLNYIKPSFEEWLKDMAVWKTIPEGTIETAQAGVEEELKNRSEETGNTAESLGKYRDKMLVEFLKLHGKL